MAIDPQGDAHRLAVGLLVAGLALVGALVFAGVRATQTEWEPWQEAFREAGGPASARPLGVVELIGATGEVERCTTCHVGIRGTAELAAPMGGHPATAAAHLEASVGCTVCHGGTGRALTAVAAHAAPGGHAPDSLLVAPTIEAACGRCHTPGAVPGTERLARGALIFLELGCGLCHPVGDGVRSGERWGPDLTELGRRTTEELERSILQADQTHGHSEMPSFARTFARDADGLQALVTYVTSLGLERPQRFGLRGAAGALFEAPCGSCHGASGRAAGPAHRCAYIHARREELRCGACHQALADERRERECPVVRQERGACGVCHEAGRW